MQIALTALTPLRRTGLAALVVGSALAAAPAGADTIDLTGTIRDFSFSHPDMEATIAGLELGIVDDQLGVDGKPVFSGNVGGVGSSVSNAANFNQWYNDVPGVNLATSHMITLDNTITPDPSVYTFASNSFFPIDGELFGNEGNIHNYHFTYEIHSSFTYTGGEMFEFTGDDDLWVFINDELAVDIGGVHGALSSGVDLDTLGLTVGETYSFDLFFAERHLTQSNFRIDTSIVLNSTEVPEPGEVLLGLAALAGIFIAHRRRRAVAVAVAA